MNFSLVIQLLLSNFENKGSRYLKFLQIIYYTYLYVIFYYAIRYLNEKIRRVIVVCIII